MRLEYQRPLPPNTDFASFSEIEKTLKMLVLRYQISKKIGFIILIRRRPWFWVRLASILGPPRPPACGIRCIKIAFLAFTARLMGSQVLLGGLLSCLRSLFRAILGFQVVSGKTFRGLSDRTLGFSTCTDDAGRVP